MSNGPFSLLLIRNQKPINIAIPDEGARRSSYNTKFRRALLLLFSSFVLQLRFYLRRRRRLCFWFGLFVCLSVGLLANLRTDFDEIFWRGRAWLNDQVIQFWWRSRSRFGSGSPKSEIRILRIGRGLCSLSAFLVYYCAEMMKRRCFLTSYPPALSDLLLGRTV